MEFENISKFKGAEEQLITAINLYFTGGSAVSVHTLCRASHEVLDKICEYKNLERSVIHQGSTQIKPESKKLFFKKLNEARNFFKHADEDPDPDGVISWNPELSRHYILDAITLYRRIAGDKMPRELTSFFIWYRINNPEMWDNTPTELESQIMEARVLLKNTDKKTAYNLLMEVCKTNTPIK